MPWYMPHVPENIKKRACIYLLQRYLGNFFQEKLSLDQLSVDLYNGTGTVKNISLDVQALNELGEKQNWPMEFVDGYVEELFICVPWSSLLKDSSFIEVRELKITIQPKQRSGCATSMFESMWSSMSSSMQLAEECLKQDPSSTTDLGQPLEVIERFAQTIDSVLSRVKVKFVDTIIQIEHVPKDSITGVAVLITIPHMEYMDAAGDDPSPSDSTSTNGTEQNKAFIVSSFTTKNFYFEGVALSTVEFPSRARTFARSVVCHSENQDSDKEEYVPMVDKGTLKSTDKYQDSPDLKSYSSERHVVQFGRLAGKQIVSICLKQSEEVQGPKVSLSFDMGSLIVFLSPRQCHVLLELANGLASPDLVDNSNIIPHHRCSEKPMSGLDFQRIEQELQSQLHPLSTYQAPGLQGIKSWSTNGLDESDSDDNFLPMKNKNSTEGLMYDSALSGVSSSMDSSITSSTSSFLEQPIRSRRRVCSIESDPTAEISNFKITIASVAIIILHEDIIAVSADQEELLLSSSVKQMQNTADEFFNNFTLFGTKDFDTAREQFEKACSLNHLRLLAAPLHIEGNEMTTLTVFSISGKVSVAKLELLECLSNGKGAPIEYIKLLHFNDLEQNLQNKPNFKVIFKHIRKKSSVNRPSSIPRTDIVVVLESCSVEVDVTIIDRLCALLNPQKVCVVEHPANIWSASPDPTITNGSRIDFKITSPCIHFHLRFPIPDFRPAYDMQRNPWWKRNVRSDYIVVKVEEVSATTMCCTNQFCQKYEVQCNTAELSYVEADSTVLLPIAKIGAKDKCGSSLASLLNYPRLELLIYPTVKPELQFDHSYEAQCDSTSQSAFDVLSGTAVKDNGPFTSKRVVHESDTPHTRPHQEDLEELIMPGDKQEMSNFIETTMHSSKIQLSIKLPSVTMQLVSKYIYELLYNRINNDLLLWTPTAPLSTKKHDYKNFLGNSETRELFSMCKSGLKYDSDTESDEDDTIQSGIYYSSYDKIKHLYKAQLQTKPYRQSFFSLNLQISSGMLSMHVPVRDASLNVIPGQHGEYLFNMENVNVFSVSGYCGDENLGYVCVQANNAQLYHCDMMSTSSQTSILKDIGSAISKHLHPTIYKLDPGVVFSTTDRTGGREMLSIAVRIQANHETHFVKTVRVALGISKATLRHRICQEPNSWITQIIDFFTVLDYPIPGYLSKDVLTELHLHLWNCAIDYRPLYLPLRSLVTMGNFTMSSHLTAQSNTSTLTFIAEDGAIFLSNKAPAIGGIPSTVPVDLIRDYVCVVEVCLFELSLKTTDKNSGINPHIDLRASNNIVHIRTCADSARALMQLITYYANDGDFGVTETNSFSSNNSPQHQSEQELVNVDSLAMSDLSQSLHEHVNNLIDEAMIESLNVEEEVLEASSSGAKMFFFPDETHKDLGKPLPQVIHDFGDIVRHSSKSSDTDDDFCFIGDEVGVGLMPKNGVPEIRWLTNDPLKVIDNHFVIPVGKTDILKSPRDFPSPVTKCTLCEMSIIWHMYGGNDFNAAPTKRKKTVSIYDEVGYSNTQTGEVIFTNNGNSKKTHLNWQTHGGSSRNHDVLMEFQLNKVRFLHEVYPENQFHASRQVLIINELEIRDRLASSQINKFLYQYTSQARPKQSNANMVVIKAVHIRPDPKLKTQECALNISLLPLRLNIDQDALLFLIAFFTELSGGSTSDFSTTSSKNNTPTHQRPIMTVNLENEHELAQQAQKMVDENLLILLEENRTSEEPNNIPYSGITNDEESPPIYFRSLVFSPEVLIRLDYQGKRVDMTHGPLPGLLMGLWHLNCSELKLKRLSHRHGLLGFEKLLNYCLHEWLQDIKRNQLPSLLGGVGPMHSLVQLFQGIKDLFWLPIEQYQKDGRIVRGLQRGANSFTTSTAMAALELTSRVIHIIQITAETAYDMVSPGPSVKRLKIKGRKKRYNRPQDIREGVANAYMLVKEGLGETANNLVRAASHEHEHKGYSGAVGGVLRQIPPTVVKPIIIATEATSNLLGGMQNQLVPDARTEAKQKWRASDDF